MSKFLAVDFVFKSNFDAANHQFPHVQAVNLGFDFPGLQNNEIESFLFYNSECLEQVVCF
jgi:hypothetical protein